jgi:hypothetical protein
MNIVAPIRNIFGSKTQWSHLLIFMLIEVLLTAFLYILVIPLVFWTIYGEGAASDRIGSLPISIFIGEWAPLMVILIINAVCLYRSLRKCNIRRAKSYLIIPLVVTCLYIVRVPILNVAFSLSQ